MRHNVEIFNKNTGRPLLSTNYKGHVYVVVEEEDVGAPFFIRVINYTPARALAVVSVDGCSVLTGKDASKDDGGYILGPHEHFDIKGWRRGLDNVAEFVFTGLEESYAALTNRPANVGVVGAYFFEEAVYERPTSFFSANKLKSKGRACSFGPESVGTGYGKEVSDQVREGTFVRSKRQPVKFVLYYNTRKQLKDWGVPLPTNIQPVLDAFPGDKPKGPFVPAP